MYHRVLVLTVRSLVLSAALLCCALILFAVPARAAINPQINFQGKLTNPDGTNVTNGTYSIVFTIYSGGTSSGGGTNVWTETQSSVTVTDGIFQVALGSVNATLASAVDFNTTPLFLGVKVGADAEMLPRIAFTAAPYAFNAERLGGLTSAGFLQLSPGSQQTGNIDISGNITAGGTYNGNTFSSSQLQFSAASTASLLSANGQQLSLDSGTGSTVAVGATNATAVTLGKVGTVVNAPGGVIVDSGASAPTADQFVVDNTTSSGVTTDGVNGASIRYKGGAAAVEASGLRVDFAPGGTSGGTWSGLRIVETAGIGAGVNAYGIKLEGAAAGTGTSTAVRVASGWDIGVDIQAGGIQLASEADPAAPAAGNLRIYAKEIAGRVLPKWIGPSGVDTPFQASIGFNRIAWLAPAGGTTLASFVNGIGTTFTNVGTAANPVPASTNILTSIRRATFSTGTTINTVTYHRQNTLQVWRGNAAGLGGFFYTTRFGTSSLQTGNRIFTGLADTIGNPTNVDPTTNTTPGKIGMAVNASTGNWNLVHNVTGTAPTIIALGANFPVNTTSLYELILFSAPNGSSIGYRVKNMGSGQTVSGTLSTNIPSNTTFLAPQHWAVNNGVAAAVVFDFSGWYLESDN